jgi:translation initiation factor 3 subunit I
LFTAGGDNVIMWEAETGCRLYKWSIGAGILVRSVALSDSQEWIVVTSSGKKNALCFFKLYGGDFMLREHFETEDIPEHVKEIQMEIPCPDSKPTHCIWGPGDQYVIASFEDGSVQKFDMSTGEPLKKIQPHSESVNRITRSPDRQSFVTASGDQKSKLIDMDTFEVVKTYETNRPINIAFISPKYHHVMLAGGQKASEVTTTASHEGKFTILLYHLIYGNEIGSIRGHFGPVNALAISPDGSTYVTGGEDGTVRLQRFDADYYDIVEKDAYDDGGEVEVEELDEEPKEE